MSVPTVTPRNVEREFEIKDLFFSTTDKKGIITSGNSVFCRVAGYEPRQMIGKPHNLVRHPDMPRCVFQLLWDYIAEGRAIAAYVKNMAMDGSYYWVLATVTPVENGYLSVRLKPSSSYFAVVQPLYAELREIEREVEARTGDRKQAIAASTRRLLEALGQHGFTDYDSFMRTVLPEEIESRDRVRAGGAIGSEPVVRTTGSSSSARLARTVESAEVIGRQLGRVFANLGSYRSLNEQLWKVSTFLRELAEDVRLFSLNAVVSAGHLEAAGVALGEVAVLMCTQSDQVSGSIGELNDEIGHATELLQGVAFQTAVARLQVEMTVQFARELLSETASSDISPDVLWRNVGALSVCLDRGLEDLATLPRRLQGVLERIHQVQGGLRVLNALQFNGRVECARLRDADTFSVLFDEIGGRLASAAGEISGLEYATQDVAERTIDSSFLRQHIAKIERNAEADRNPIHRAA
ncbi:MAG: PAS domain-containing protein [Candidatus Eisenbacteria bacterium]|nr:PAS domain-containing protein [Candidatus Eisenbacteria bacterium]MCC7143204.1 PAS domain-containing protein [Candidatus Eisenbacteria bacterium]